MLLFPFFMGVVLIAGGLAAAYFAILGPVYALGVSIAGLLLLDGLFVTSLSKYMRYENGRYLCLFFGLLAWLFTGLLATQAFLNPLHDITNDTANPPKIHHRAFAFPVAKGGEYLDATLAIPGDFDSSTSDSVTAHYPDLEPLKTRGSAGAIYDALAKHLATQPPSSSRLANQAAAFLYGLAPPLRPISQDEKTHHLEYELEMPVLRFVSDISIDVRGNGDAASVAARVRTRVPLPDLGWGAFVLRDLSQRISDIAAAAPAKAPEAPAAETKAPETKPTEPNPIAPKPAKEKPAK